MKVSLVLAVLTLAYRWLIQYETFSKLNRVLLWLNAIAAWTLPLVALPSWGPVKMQTEFHQQIPKVVGKLPVINEPAVLSGQFKAPVTEAPSMSVADWILAIYLAGLFVLAACFLWQIARLVRVIAKGRAERCSDGTSIVRVSGSAPYSFFQWIVVDPSKHSENALHNIIAHESEHARQWHSADLLLAEMQKICLWFNPFAWIHQKLVQENLEYLADRAVLDNGFEKKQYQYNLLNTLMRARESPLTNSFARSLLKKRIQMMNRKPSHYLAWSKYAALIALIYISSAFVAPYRDQIAALAPAPIRSVVKPLIGEVVKSTPIPAGLPEPEIAPGPVTPQPLVEKQEPVIRQMPDSVVETVSKKGILIVGKTLYWAITPIMTWEDINEIKAEVEKFGQHFQINQLQFDPLQKYITAVSVRITSKGGFGTGEETSDSQFDPMKGYSGYISSVGLGMGQAPPAPLAEEMERDYQKALVIAKQNEVAHFEYKLGKSLGTYSSNTFTSEVLTGPNAATFYNKHGFGKSEENTLYISAYHKNATFYLNTSPSTFTELNNLPFPKVERITLMQDNAGRKYIVVYAK